MTLRELKVGQSAIITTVGGAGAGRASGAEIGASKTSETGRASEAKAGHASDEETKAGKALRQHFLDMGIIPGIKVTLEKFAPMGDPIEINIRGYELTLRLADAQEIEVMPVEVQETKENVKKKKRR